MRRILSLIALIFLGGLYYLGNRLVSPLSVSPFLKIVFWGLLATPFFVMSWLPLFYWRQGVTGKARRQFAFIVPSYSALGFLSLLLCVVLFRDLLALVFRGAGLFGIPVVSLYGNRGSAVVFALAVILTLIGFQGSRRTPPVKRVKVPIPNLPVALEGFKIAQLSDVHVGPLIRRKFVERVVERTNSLEPDLIALTGDIIDGAILELQNEVAPFAELRSREGSFFVTGNHEYYWGAKDWIAEWKRLGITPLENSHQVIQRGEVKILIAGVNDLAAKSFDASAACDPVKAIQGAPACDFKLLLAHQPKVIYAAEKVGYDLQLSGHTHGGQFLPWTLVIRLFQPFVKGLNRHGKMWLYVSRGTGSWGPPIRVGAPSEITLLTLVRG